MACLCASQMQVEKEVQKELDAEKPQGEEALNNLFKQIYGNVRTPSYLVLNILACAAHLLLSCFFSVRFKTISLFLVVAIRVIFHRSRRLH